MAGAGAGAGGRGGAGKTSFPTAQVRGRDPSELESSLPKRARLETAATGNGGDWTPKRELPDRDGKVARKLDHKQNVIGEYIAYDGEWVPYDDVRSSKPQTLDGKLVDSLPRARGDVLVFATEIVVRDGGRDGRSRRLPFPVIGDDDRIDNFTLSRDERSVFFVTERWDEDLENLESTLSKMDLDTGDISWTTAALENQKLHIDDQTPDGTLLLVKAEEYEAAVGDVYIISADTGYTQTELLGAIDAKFLPRKPDEEDQCVLKMGETDVQFVNLSNPHADFGAPFTTISGGHMFLPSSEQKQFRVAISPDGNLTAIVKPKQLYLWRRGSDRRWRRIAKYKISNYTGSPHIRRMPLAFSSDGTVLLYGRKLMTTQKKKNRLIADADAVLQRLRPARGLRPRMHLTASFCFRDKYCMFLERENYREFGCLIRTDTGKVHHVFHFSAKGYGPILPFADGILRHAQYRVYAVGEARIGGRQTYLHPIMNPSDPRRIVVARFGAERQRRVQARQEEKTKGKPLSAADPAPSGGDGSTWPSTVLPRLPRVALSELLKQMPGLEHPLTNIEKP